MTHPEQIHVWLLPGEREALKRAADICDVPLVEFARYYLREAMKQVGVPVPPEVERSARRYTRRVMKERAARAAA